MACSGNNRADQHKHPFAMSKQMPLALRSFEPIIIRRLHVVQMAYSRHGDHDGNPSKSASFRQFCFPETTLYVYDPARFCIAGRVTLEILCTMLPRKIYFIRIYEDGDVHPIKLILGKLRNRAAHEAVLSTKPCSTRPGLKSRIV